ncbi:hypothetical protein GCM10023310_11390 [Paenibacillus vulneris]
MGGTSIQYTVSYAFAQFEVLENMGFFLGRGNPIIEIVQMSTEWIG